MSEDVGAAAGSTAVPVAAPAPLLSARGVAKRYGPVEALSSVDLEIAPGEIHALLGANGAGKSTLVKVLTGVVPADVGTISVDGAERRLTRPSDARDAGLAPVFQDPALVGDLTVAQNLWLTGADEARVVEWLERMGLAGVDLGAHVKDLPLPLLRMVDLARALSYDPLLLMLDEITAALPADLADRVFDVMRRWRERGRSVLFITHRLAEVMAVCDRATVLRDGRAMDTFAPSDGGEERLVRTMMGPEAAGRRGAPVAPGVDTRAGEPSLEVRGLGRGTALSDVSFTLHRGEVLGIAALEGQGQDVLFDVLAGELRPTRGQILVDGEPLTARSPHDAIRRGVVLVPSDRLTALLPQRSVRENLAAPLYNRLRSWGLVNAGKEERKVDDAIERLAIDTRAQSQMRRLSGGNQQKVTVGRWLTAGFRTLLCFDPTRGIDIGTKRQMYALLRELAAEGAAVLVYTSELSEIAQVCDRALVMYAGEIVGEVAGADADEETLLTAAHGLGSGEAA